MPSIDTGDRKLMDDAEELIGTLHPFGEPSPIHTRRAGSELAELVEYLVRATLPQNVGRALHKPSHTDRLVSHLTTSAQQLPQLAAQIRRRLEQHRDNPHLRSDNMGKPPLTAQEHAQAAIDILDGVEPLLMQLHDMLNEARRHTARLALNEPEGYDDGVRYADMDEAW